MGWNGCMLVRIRYGLGIGHECLVSKLSQQCKVAWVGLSLDETILEAFYSGSTSQSLLSDIDVVAMKALVVADAIPGSEARRTMKGRAQEMDMIHSSSQCYLTYSC